MHILQSNKIGRVCTWTNLNNNIKVRVIRYLRSVSLSTHRISIVSLFSLFFAHRNFPREYIVDVGFAKKSLLWFSCGLFAFRKRVPVCLFARSLRTSNFQYIHVLKIRSESFLSTLSNINAFGNVPNVRASMPINKIKDSDCKLRFGFFCETVCAAVCQLNI